ncbi:hypothetical protein BS47DRAFT_1364751 [Hydnum rufescens UP504]|uniref:Uncharacterized protein n=1 Tax=Hydnum rufescens UP504 TaxID=1448309 RepID=A0A9P6DPK7_9AGAM|nr:hypothetical protein BS47DRAFT_1364751 [Hydnum rufescens UP504]
MPSTPTPDLTCLFVSTGIPYASSHCRLHNWIDRQEGLFANGLSMLVIWCILADIQLTSIWTHGGSSAIVLEVTKDSQKQAISSFVGIHPYWTQLHKGNDIPIHVSQVSLESEQMLRTWGFERLKDIKIKRFLTMTRRGNSAKNLTSVARDPADQCALCDTLTLLGISYKVPQPATRDPDCFLAWRTWMSCTPATVGMSVNVTTEKCKAVDPSTLEESASKHIRMADDINPNSAGSLESAVPHASMSSSSTEVGMANTPGSPAFRNKDEPKVLIWAEGGGNSKEIEQVDAICPHRLSPCRYFIL